MASSFTVHRDKIFFIQIENWLIHPRLVIDCNAFLYKRIKNFVKLDRHNNAIILFLYWKTDYYTSFLWNQLSPSLSEQIKIICRDLLMKTKPDVVISMETNNVELYGNNDFLNLFKSVLKIPY